MSIEAQELHTVGEVIDALKEFSRDAKIVATWEGLNKSVRIYPDTKGEVIIDADDGYIQARTQELPCEDCGKPACGFFDRETTYCYACWKAHDE